MSGFRWWGIGWTAGLLLCCTSGALASELEDYSELDLSDLAALSAEVFSASKKNERVVETPASVYVIGPEEIRRSGHTHIAELLRLVPGLNVARIGSSRWAVSARGFNHEFASKLLVLIDGRVVYTPAFSGVYWNLQDMVLDDVERIEVIRGPGAAIWGSNAVNGVINVITRSSRQTPGTFARAVVGTEDRAILSMRTAGGQDDLHYRFYGKMSNRDSSVDLKGHHRADEWRAQRSGVRLDWTPSDRDAVWFDGSIYHGDQGNAVRDFDPLTFAPRDSHVDASNNGGHAMVHWDRVLSERQSLSFQATYDQLLQRGDLFEDVRHTAAGDAQHRIALSDRNEVTWGLGYRLSSFRLSRSTRIGIGDRSGADVTYSSFVQDEIRLGDRFKLTAGSKFEWNDISGWEAQPSLRGIWLATPSQQLWAAVSRAVRTPSRGELGANILFGVLPPNSLFPGSPLTPIVSASNPRLEPEELIAYELGYRTQLHDRVSLDVSAFWNHYDNGVSAPLVPPFFLSTSFKNDKRSRALGGEALLDWKARSWWKLTFGYSMVDVESAHAGFFFDDKTAPRHQMRVSSLLDLPAELELDTTVYYTGSIDDLGRTSIDSFVRFDARLGWHPAPRFSIDLVGQNLFDRQHPEVSSLFSPDGVSQIERAAYVRMTVKF
jgi:iron complex outermembrane recepter protein